LENLLPNKPKALPSTTAARTKPTRAIAQEDKSNALDARGSMKKQERRNVNIRYKI